jgi:uncharacterized protein (TIGR03083 family)
MTISAAEDVALREAIAAERGELAELLRGLPPAAWEAPTLCAGWRVRDVVAHVTMPFRYSTGRFVMEVIRDRGKFNRMADRCARRDATRPTGELLAALSDNARNPWKPPGGGFEGALVHDVIHGLDITVALGIDRVVPEDRLRVVLHAVSKPETMRHFGTDLNGIELRADDMAWSFGSGTPVAGQAQDLALVLCGRMLPAGRLGGELGTRFEGG